jgi:hypothetical protein
MPRRRSSLKSPNAVDMFASKADGCTKPLPFKLRTYAAWRFDAVLPGHFRRNKAEFAHHLYPIVAPLPTAGRNTPPLEPSDSTGPYVYFVCDDLARVRYIGKSLEEHVIQRWVRPGIGGTAKHYWTHSTRAGGAVFQIARGLQARESGHYELRYAPVREMETDLLSELGVAASPDHALTAAQIEVALIRVLGPDWNVVRLGRRC